ncbi:uncharacterized protein TNIN_472081 [Trichonephila inaurata madagascariensis]|uniref:Uncharacterized protein n=1 Tax=Trichonephila inaurata madagascariensis TaxID=2747483 RepID=A0A8X7C302_9ARAC|nr:uncharacterized protein TNIN_436381 [Trichonephila inaurata madagascariensis]GFY69351.1 uncharacterized protein TNIN_472081 [Trichonephila inaurata madagascariensis]
MSVDQVNYTDGVQNDSDRESLDEKASSAGGSPLHPSRSRSHSVHRHRSDSRERSRWTTATLCENMIKGDDIYQQIVIENEHRGGLAVEEDCYLEILHMNVIKHDFIMYNAFSIEYDNNTPYIDSLSDQGRL